MADADQRFTLRILTTADVGGLTEAAKAQERLRDATKQATEAAAKQAGTPLAAGGAAPSAGGVLGGGGGGFDPLAAARESFQAKFAQAQDGLRGVTAEAGAAQQATNALASGGLSAIITRLGAASAAAGAFTAALGAMEAKNPDLQKSLENLKTALKDAFDTAIVGALGKGDALRGVIDDLTIAVGGETEAMKKVHEPLTTAAQLTHNLAEAGEREARALRDQTTALNALEQATKTANQVRDQGLESERKQLQRDTEQKVQDVTDNPALTEKEKADEIATIRQQAREADRNLDMQARANAVADAQEEANAKLKVAEDASNKERELKDRARRYDELQRQRARVDNWKGAAQDTNAPEAQRNEAKDKMAEEQRKLDKLREGAGDLQGFDPEAERKAQAEAEKAAQKAAKEAQEAQAKAEREAIAAAAKQADDEAQTAHERELSRKQKEAENSRTLASENKKQEDDDFNAMVDNTNREIEEQQKKANETGEKVFKETVRKGDDLDTLERERDRKRSREMDLDFGGGANGGVGAGDGGSSVDSGSGVFAGAAGGRNGVTSDLSRMGGTGVNGNPGGGSQGTYSAGVGEDRGDGVSSAAAGMLQAVDLGAGMAQLMAEVAEGLSKGYESAANTLASTVAATKKTMADNARIRRAQNEVTVGSSGNVWNS